VVVVRVRPFFALEKSGRFAKRNGGELEYGQVEKL
jgi:hypothetical protein